MKKPYYSIGIIFKNEIRCLERCLKSLQPLRDAVPCELVMADTGSTDGSREVAEKYADILFDFPWIDDFAAARNAVMDRCSGQWYLSIDADEWLDKNIQELKLFCNAKKTTDFGGIMIRNYRESGTEDDQNYLDFTGIRLARLKPEIRYEGVIHESFRAAAGGRVRAMILSKTWFHHDGYMYENKAAEKAKFDRNITLLKKKLEENPKNFQTLVEFIDCTKYTEYELAAEYSRRIIRGVQEKWDGYEKYTTQILHIVLSAAMVQDLPEFDEWLALAVELCPDSIFTRVDVSYFAFAHYWNKHDYEKVVYWGEAYENGIADYHAERFDLGELLRGVLENTSPLWIQKVAVLMPQAYLECDMPEKAFAGFRKINGSELEDVQHVELCTQVLMRLHRTTELDAASLMATFWEQVNRPRPDEELANRRRRALLRVAENAFRDDYRQEEEEREDYLRHSFTVFSDAAEDCPLRHAAAILAETEPARLAQCLAKIDDWTEVPIAALAHALEWGAAFPLMEKQLYIEKLDLLAGRLAQDQARFFPLACRILETEPTTEQELLWQRGVAIAAVRVFAWQSEEADAELGLRLARGFANAEREFLPLCYAPGCFAEGRLYSIAPMHRFGWHCARAFAALDSGDAVGYVRQLRAGLSAYEGMKPMAQFLMDHTPALAEPSPSAELKALADQVRVILSRFAPDDPAAVALKSSEAYQKVAYLIEGAAAPVMGRALQ